MYLSILHLSMMYPAMVHLFMMYLAMVRVPVHDEHLAHSRHLKGRPGAKGNLFGALDQDTNSI